MRRKEMTGRKIRKTAVLLLTAALCTPAVYTAAKEPVSAYAATQAPVNLKTEIAYRQVTVSWDVVPGASCYALFLKRANGETVLIDNRVKGTSYVVPGLENGVSVGFAVKAYANGSWSGWSSTAWARPEAVAVAPKNVTAVSQDGLVTIRWDAVPGASAYALYLKNSDGTAALVQNHISGTSYEISGLAKDRRIGFVVKSYVNRQWSGWSSTAWTTVDRFQVYIPINETNFPDEIFREYVKQFDLNKDGHFTEEELGKVSIIDLKYKKVTSVKGVEFFKELEQLDLTSNKLTSLDISKNTELKKLKCESNSLTSLDVSQNTKLDYLACSSNQLTSLDVSKNVKLRYLFCQYMKIAELDVSNNKALVELRGGHNQLTKLDVSQNLELREFHCDSNRLTELDISANTHLDYFYCEYNQLKKLDVSNNTGLSSLWCSGNQLTELDVSKHVWLQELLCGGNQLTALDVSNNTRLKQFHCNYNRLTKLDVSKNTKLKDFSCSNNQLTVLDVSNNPLLESLWCEENQLTSLDLRNNPKVKTVIYDTNVNVIR